MEMFRVIYGGVDYKAKEDGGVTVHPKEQSLQKVLEMGPSVFRNC